MLPDTIALSTEFLQEHFPRSRKMNHSLRRVGLVALRSECRLSRETKTVMPPLQQLFHTVAAKQTQLSSLHNSFHWDHDENDEDPPVKHCATCTCTASNDKPPPIDPLPHVCSRPVHAVALPPPLPEPKYSVFKRVLPKSLVQLDSKLGRQYLLESLSSSTAESYWALSQHFTNQSDPAYCGVTSLIMVLNSMGVDPQVRWRGGWRFYGSEDTLLDRCCIPKERVQRIGIDMEDFAQLAKCQGLRVQFQHCGEPQGLQHFRTNVQHALSSPSSILVVSFGRSKLGQTGDGHFSPIGAYHAKSEMILVMDVARFKYPCYWVSIEDMYDAMCEVDATTLKPRGWFVLQPPERSALYNPELLTEHRRPVSIVRQLGTGDVCPVGPVKVKYCPANELNKK